MTPSNRPASLGILLIAGLGAIGLALGYALTSMALGPAMAPNSSSGAASQGPGARSAACPPTVDPDELQAEFEAIEAQAAFVEGQLRLVGGLPSHWPQPADGPAADTRLREAISAELEALDGLGGWALDCDEDPCVVVSWMDLEADHEVYKQARQIASDAELSRPIVAWRGLDERPAVRIHMSTTTPFNPEPWVMTRAEHRAWALFDRLSAPAEPPPP